MEAYSVDVWGKLAGEDEAVDALLKARDVHDLHKVAFHRAKLLRIAQSLVFGVLTLHSQAPRHWHKIIRLSCWGCERLTFGGGGVGGEGRRDCAMTVSFRLSHI